MRTLVISYSLTGNNESLASTLADDLQAKHLRITEAKPRTMGTIALDMLFGRAPVIELPHDGLEAADLLVFVGPVWMGAAASPFRSCFARLKSLPNRYVYATISGGALGPNSRLASELRKRLGREPAALFDLHIANLLPTEPKPTRKETSAYRLDAATAKRLGDQIIAGLREARVL